MSITASALAELQATALASVASAVVITDRDGTVEWVNAAFTRMSGYPPEEIVGCNPRVLSSGAHDAGFYEQLWLTILAGEIWRGEVVERHRDGHLYTVEQTITPLVDATGTVTHFVSVHEDVTALRASQQRLQAMFDLALDAMFLADDHGRYVEINPAACELLGYRRDELLSMSVADVAAGSEGPPEAVGELFASFLAHGDQAGSFAMRHRTGRVIETEYRASANILPGLHLSVVRDVTERNASIRALAASEARFRGLAEHASDVVLIGRLDDLRLELDYVNPAAAHLFDLPIRSGQHHSLIDGCHPDDLPDLEQLLAASRTGPARGLLRFIDGAGRWITLEALVTQIPVVDGQATVQVIARDVTEQQATQQALQDALASQREVAQALQALNATKDRILQNVSHELRTPITVIVGLADALAHPELGLDPDQAHDFRTRIGVQAARLERLLDDLLHARTTSDTASDLRLHRVDIADLVRAALGRADLGARPVIVDLDPVTAIVDPNRIARAIDSLLDNIARHTPPDTPVAVQLRASDGHIQLTIDDHGPGIPPTARDRAFDPLYQGPAALHAAQPGAGLGLAIVRNTARAHGGHAWLDDTATGTRIHVTLPRCPHSRQPDGN